MTRFCDNPFRWLDLTAWLNNTLKFSMCVESWGGEQCRLAVVPLSLAARVDILELWNSEHAQNVRKQWLSGIADMCQACPRLKDGYAPPRDRKTDDGSLPIVNDGPRLLNIAYDRSCNLACGSCRPCAIRWLPGTETHYHLKRFQDRQVRPLLRNATTAFMSGLGDPFGSPLYWELLSTLRAEEAPSLKWYILTNGQGFTPANYAAIPTRSQINAVQVSVDAATAEVYAANRGGSWSTLVENLQFIGNLRRAGSINDFSISMVVQENNFGQMPQFAEWAKSLGCDQVQFNSLLNQSYAPEDYRRRAVHLPGHPAHAGYVNACHAVKGVDGIPVLIEMPRD